MSKKLISLTPVVLSLILALPVMAYQPVMYESWQERLLSHGFPDLIFLTILPIVLLALIFITGYFSYRSIVKKKFFKSFMSVTVATILILAEVLLIQNSIPSWLFIFGGKPIVDVDNVMLKMEFYGDGLYKSDTEILATAEYEIMNPDNNFELDGVFYRVTSTEVKKKSNTEFSVYLSFVKEAPSIDGKSETPNTIGFWYSNGEYGGTLTYPVKEWYEEPSALDKKQGIEKIYHQQSVSLLGIYYNINFDKWGRVKIGLLEYTEKQKGRRIMPIQ